MKKIILTLLLFIGIGCISVSARSGDIIGSIYSTDIIAEVNGANIESYSLNGKTAIIVEDLANYGADVQYNDNLRTLIVNTDCLNRECSLTLNRGTVGKIAGKIYETDIKVYLNGKTAPAFSLNGRMAVAIEDIAGNGEYSDYNAKFLWNEENRKISLFLKNDNSGLISDYIFKNNWGGTVSLSDDKLSFEIDLLRKGTLSLPVPPAKEISLYCDGTEIANSYKQICAYFSNNKIEFTEKYYIFYDYGKTINSINKSIVYPTYEETMNFVNESYLPIGIVYERKDTEQWTFIYMITVLRDGGYEHLLRIGTDGSLKDYTYELPDFLHIRKIQNAVFDKENDKFYFYYPQEPTKYVIDLNSGIMSNAYTD